MENFKSHFVFNRSQRNGIFVLILVIILLQIGYFFIDFSSGVHAEPVPNEEIAAFQRTIDSLKMARAVKDSVKLFPFNPNYITDYKGYTLGMSVAEIDRLHSFRADNNWVNSAEEFQKVTGISDSLLGLISPYFSFPEWVQRRETAEVKNRIENTVAEKIDLNSATAEELQMVRGVGEVLSRRITNYRSLLKGFNSAIQLSDVYGLSPEVVERIKDRFEVIQPAREKVDLNTVSLIHLSELPYFNYETARELVRYRDSKGEVSTFDELTDLKAFSADKIDKIKLYLTID